MNYSTAIFLINQTVRAIACTYEADEKAPRTVFKSFDPSIKPGEFVIVPTDTRHKMTVVKVAEVDVDFEHIQAQEAEAIQKIKAAELRKKRSDLRDNLLALNADELQTLAIADRNGGAKAVAVSDSR